ncbi:MAG: phage major capsid protein [Clostridia bacterium]|nr:phage major capsid protein [Clostridia bacterium]
MVTLQTADNALKSFYLDAVKDGINTRVNPLLAMIESTSANVVGKDVKKAVRVALSGGINAGTETGDLPKAGGNQYKVFTASLKNLYGTIEISDKAIRASANNEGAFVNLLNDEMEGLIKSASINLGRMLFGDGKGTITEVTDYVDDHSVKVADVKKLSEGMVISFIGMGGVEMTEVVDRKIVSIDVKNKIVKVDGDPFFDIMVNAGCGVCMQGSFEQELTGLEAIFGEGNIYGVKRDCKAMQAYKMEDVGAISENILQTAIDEIEENSGSKVNVIICSKGVRRALAKYYEDRKMMLPSMEIAGGYNAISFNGIPVVSDRFCPEGTMYLLNTADFKLHQLCDWQWLEGEDGKILKQIAGKPVYTATLVKYVELMCENICGQGKLSGITEA